MKPRATGNGVTPEWFKNTIKELVDMSSMNAVSKSTGIGISAIFRYLKGEGEPTTGTIQRIANYTGKTFTIIIVPEPAHSDNGALLSLKK